MRGTAINDSVTDLKIDLLHFRKIFPEHVQQYHSSASARLCKADNPMVQDKVLRDECQSIACIPIGEESDPIGLIYLELSLLKKDAKKLLGECQQLEVFCGLVLQHLTITWRHHQQLEKAKVTEQVMWPVRFICAPFLIILRCLYPWW